jgi:murein L,D-transpeptidase YcbB/YkuD
MRTISLFTVLLTLFSLNFAKGIELDFSTPSEQIRTVLERENPGGRLIVRETVLANAEGIYRFYDSRGFGEAWSENGILLEKAYELRFEIKQSKYDGLNPANYHLALIEGFFQSFESNKQKGIPNDVMEVADLDLLLTDAFFRLAAHLEIGKVDPSKLKSSWDIRRKPQREDYVLLLSQAVQSNEIRKALEKLYPDFSIYRKGREVVRRMEELQKSDTLNWKPIKMDQSIKPGQLNNAVPLIRQRLAFWGYLDPALISEDKIYDSLLVNAVKDFQRSNGMEPDGSIGKNTAAALNSSPAALMDIAALNLERLRWLPDTVREAEFILVNIANYQLDFINKLDTLFSAKVIVGKQYHESPIFSALMSYIVFSPYWNIPNSIARAEIIPAVRRNPNYLQQKNMEVITTSGKVVDPASVNWQSKSFPYLIRQKPGGNNSLGLVKFMFPNSHSVYIHDTPGKSLFEKEDRALSHGCIRIQNPVKFAQLLLKDDPKWTPQRIDEAMHQTKEQIVNLPRKIPVVLMYLTFWADSRGKAHFRQDIYGRDADLLALLKK